MSLKVVSLKNNFKNVLIKNLEESFFSSFSSVNNSNNSLYSGCIYSGCIYCPLSINVILYMLNSK